MAAVIPAPSAKGPRQQFKIDVCALFTRYFSISASPTIRLFAESALFAHPLPPPLPSPPDPPSLRTAERFCVYSADRNARAARRFRHIIPNASLSFNRVLRFTSIYHSKEAAFSPRRDSTKKHPPCEWKMYISSAVIHLTSFALSIRCLV